MGFSRKIDWEMGLDSPPPSGPSKRVPERKGVSHSVEKSKRVIIKD